MHLSIKIPNLEHLVLINEYFLCMCEPRRSCPDLLQRLECVSSGLMTKEACSKSTKYLCRYPKPSVWVFLVWVLTCTSHNPSLNEVFSPPQSCFSAEGFIPFDKNLLGSVTRRLVCSCSPVYSCSSPEGGWCSLVLLSRSFSAACHKSET